MKLKMCVFEYAKFSLLYQFMRKTTIAKKKTFIFYPVMLNLRDNCDKDMHDAIITFINEMSYILNIYGMFTTAQGCYRSRCLDS